jgi:hypothetical protein
MESSVVLFLLSVVLVFKDIIYIINILYTRDIWLSVSTFGRMCGTIDHRSCIRWVLGFGIKPSMTHHKVEFWIFSHNFINFLCGLKNSSKEKPMKLKKINSQFVVRCVRWWPIWILVVRERCDRRVRGCKRERDTSQIRIRLIFDDLENKALFSVA